MRVARFWIFSIALLSNSQTRVPDLTGILKDRPDYSSVEVQQVPDRNAGSLQQTKLD